jgi:hypothetical protein
VNESASEAARIVPWRATSLSVRRRRTSSISSA